MTKTQALFRLYKAIGGEQREGINTSTKVLEKIAEEVEEKGIMVGRLEFESGTWVPDEDTTHGTINLHKTHTKPPAIALVWDPSETVISVEDGVSHLSFSSFIDLYQVRGERAIPGNPNYCGHHIYSSWSSSGAGGTRARATTIINPYTAGYYDSAKYTKYFAEEDKIHPYGDSYSCKAGHTYNWLAIWI